MRLEVIYDPWLRFASLHYPAQIKTLTMEDFLNGEWLKIDSDGILYYRFYPTYPVNMYVDHFLVGKGVPEFASERVFPNNEVELFFNLGDVNRGTLRSSDDYNFKQTVISGLRNSPLQIVPGRLFFIAGMRFSMFGFYHLFKMPGHEISNGNFSGRDVLGKEIEQLWQKLGDLGDLTVLIKAMHGWVTEKIKNCDPVPHSWKRIDTGLKTSQFNIKKELPHLLGYSYKHSLKIFRQICGLHPKTIQRIYRINNLLSHPEILANPGWAGLSFQFGFSDQSHLIREFKEFTGLTPTEFLTSRPKDFLLKQRLVVTQ